MPTTRAPKAPPATQWLTVDEAAKYARVSVGLIYRSAQDHTLSGVKLDPANKKSPWRFTANDVDAWLERGRIKVAS